MDDAEKAWKRCRPNLMERVKESSWFALFETVSPVSFNNNQLILSVHSTIAKNRIEERYMELIVAVLIELGYDHPRVTIEVQKSPDESTQYVGEPRNSRIRGENPLFNTSSSRTPDHKDGRLLHNDQNRGFIVRSYTFDAFVSGSSNRFAHAAALSVAETPSRSYNPLFIHGKAGLGKTHLLHAIGNYTIENYPTLTARYVSTETFLNEFVDAIRKNTTSSFKRRYRECDVLLIDDVQFLEGRESLQEEFFHTFNHLHAAGKQMVLTSDRPPKAIATLEERLRSRFLSGLITDVQPPEVETRLAILQKKSELMPNRIPFDVLEYIAQVIKDNIRELEGALIRVSAFASLNSMQITVPLAKELLMDLVDISSHKSITPIEIIASIASYYGFEPLELQGASRKRPLVEARQVAMYVFRELTDLSFPAIGKEFGNRDHTTVMHSVNKVEASMSEDREIYNRVTALLSRIRASNM